MKLLENVYKLIRPLKRFFQSVLLFSALVLSGKSPDPGSVEALRVKALEGDRVSAFYLADAYYYGKKARKNPVLAVYWYRKAAEKGLPEAQYNLACCLESGTGCRKDALQAFSWYEKAALSGFAPASMRLFYCYRNGMKDAGGKVLVRPSPEKALAVLRDLAAREYKEALYLLADYGMRFGASAAERSESFKTVQKLILQNGSDGKALRMLADCYFGGIGCEKDPEKTVSLLKKAMKLQDAQAIAKLGFLYEHGYGSLQKDASEALSHYKKAAEMNHPVGQYKYGLSLRNMFLQEQEKKKGEGDEKEESESPRSYLPWLERSASQEYGPALHILGMIYLEGRETRKDLRKAAGYFFRAARGGNVQAQYQLAQMFRSGAVNNRADHEAAFYWYLNAALQGYVPAMHAAADCYLDGRGVERSAVKGIRLLRAAAERGDFSARRKLQRLLRAESYNSGLY